MSGRQSSCGQVHCAGGIPVRACQAATRSVGRVGPGGRKPVDRIRRCSSHRRPRSWGRMSTATGSSAYTLRSSSAFHEPRAGLFTFSPHRCSLKNYRDRGASGRQWLKTVSSGKRALGREIRSNSMDLRKPDLELRKRAILISIVLGAICRQYPTESSTASPRVLCIEAWQNRSAARRKWAKLEFSAAWNRCDQRPGQRTCKFARRNRKYQAISINGNKSRTWDK